MNMKSERPTLVAVTASFAVLRRVRGGDENVMTVLTDLFDLDLHPYRPRGLPTYAEAVHVATERGLARSPVCGFIPVFGMVQFVPVCERMVLEPEEFHALARAIGRP
jgi:hypothetical protein